MCFLTKIFIGDVSACLPPTLPPPARASTNGHTKQKQNKNKNNKRRNNVFSVVFSNGTINTIFLHSHH